MKKMLIILLAILAILIGTLMVVGKDSSATFYADAPHLAYNQLTDDADGQNLYYFYQDDCHFCNEIKPQMADFFYSKPADIDFYLIDIAPGKGNDDVWFDKSTGDFTAASGKLDDYNDIKVTGTPTLVETTDGEITQFLVGAADIPEYIESLNA